MEQLCQNVYLCLLIYYAYTNYTFCSKSFGYFLANLGLHTKHIFELYFVWIFKYCRQIVYRICIQLFFSRCVWLAIKKIVNLWENITNLNLSLSDLVGPYYKYQNIILKNIDLQYCRQYKSSKTTDFTTKKTERIIY